MIAIALKARPTLEGAGVHLKRAFGYDELPQFDPFLLLDDFGSDNPRDYILGFPWHPHRGIETVTYVLDGAVKHEDSLGNKGIINSGDIQWMTAGSGIVHQEMPQQFQGLMRGFQLWVNLPKKDKMMPPRYQEIKSAQIPETSYQEAKIKIIAGTINNITGPVKDIIADPLYLDIILDRPFTLPDLKDRTTVIYIIEGSCIFDKEYTRETLLLIEDEQVIKPGNDGARILLIAGKPIQEPIAWYGPIVMNTEEELKTAFKEYQAGTFIK